MKNKWKKLLAMALAASMVAGVLNMGALAAEEAVLFAGQEEGDESVAQPGEDEEVISAVQPVEDEEVISAVQPVEDEEVVSAAQPVEDEEDGELTVLSEEEPCTHDGTMSWINKDGQHVKHCPACDRDIGSHAPGEGEENCPLCEGAGDDCPHTAHSQDGICVSCGREVGHTWDTVAEEKATCMQEGYRVEQCSVCSKMNSVTLSAPDNHAGGTGTRDAKPATFDEAGYTGDTYCLGCGETIESGEDIPQLVAVAKITVDGEDVRFETLQAAIDSVEEDGSAVIEVVADSDRPATVPAGKSITLDIPEGITLTNSAAPGSGWGNSTLRNFGSLTVNGEGTILADAKKGNSMVLYNYEGGTAVLNGCTYRNDNGDYTVWNKGTMTIEDATMIKEKGGSPSVIINAGELGKDGDEKYGNLTINHCVVNANCGSSNCIAIKNDDSGKLVVNDGDFQAKFCLQNFSTAIINGGNFTNNYSNGVCVFYSDHQNDTDRTGKLTINGGNFYAVREDAVAVYLKGDVDLQISGGTYFREDDATVSAYATEGRYLVAFEGKDQNGEDATRWRVGYCTVTFDANGGSQIPAQDITTKGGQATRPANPTRSRYSFTGWTLDGEAYDFSAPVTGDITLVAQWERDRDDDDDDRPSRPIETPEPSPEPVETPEPVPSEEPVVTPEPPAEELPEEDVPLAELPEEDVPLAELPEPDIPLAQAPETGDSLALWAVMALCSLLGLACLGKRKKEA